MNIKITSRQFKRKFRSESDCLRYLIKRKWPHGFKCPRCGDDRYYLLESRKVYQCKRCKHQTSVTANTIFHKTRKPLRDWFWAIALVVTKTTGSVTLQVQRDLNLSYPTAWTWCQKIRTVLENHKDQYYIKGLIEVYKTCIDIKNKPGKQFKFDLSKMPEVVPIKSLIKEADKNHYKTSGYLILRGNQKSMGVFSSIKKVTTALTCLIRCANFNISVNHMIKKNFIVAAFDGLVKACCLSRAITYEELIADLNF